ncbi:MAG: hypothetical protein P8183_08505, partial [Anaerolineae bacterium]
NPAQEVLNAADNVGGSPFQGAKAVTELELISGADPYFTDINPAQNNEFWLSQDLRVFTATPGVNPVPVAGGPSFTNDSFAGAYAYIQSLLAFLNNPANHFTDGTNDPFNTILPNQAGALTADSSVSRYTITSAFPLQFANNYNFAIARVRLRGTVGPAGQAQNVKVFFRMWSTQTADTGFDPNSTYRSHRDGSKPHWPLPAPDSHTIPFFATSNSPNLSNPNNPEYGSNGINNQTLIVTSGDYAWAYFGCFLNVYDSANVVNGSQVQALLVGTHHCLVAELAYDDAPIINANGLVATPESSDKLAQRNLQLTYSDNPGPADTHRIPQTFDLKPGIAIAPAPGTLLDYPDELMIDWGQTPVGSVAHIYWPQINALTVLQLANRIYGTHLLSASDSNTVDCKVEHGVTYVPIPPGTTENIAGLLTIDLPTTVVVGQEYNILVRRVSTRRQQVVEGPRVPRGPRIAAEAGTTAAAKKSKKSKTTETISTAVIPPGGHGGGTFEIDEATLAAMEQPREATSDIRIMRNWRYVVGTFQVKIPVTTREVMLRPDEDALAVMKWRLQQMAPTNRWHPVLQRYIAYLSARVAGLGGDPDAIPPSPDGAPLTPGEQALASFTGKVEEVIYDCFGHFEGFVISDCCESHAFHTRECAIADIVLRALKDCLLLTVYVEKGSVERGREACIRRLVIRS